MRLETNQILGLEVAHDQQALSHHFINAKMRSQARGDLARLVFPHVNFFAIQFVGFFMDPNFGNLTNFEFEFANIR